MLCCDCGVEFSPRRRIDRRCHDCAIRRRKTGSSGRASRTNRPSKNVALRAQDRHQKVLNTVWWGLDGEGVNRPGTGIHEYAYMAAVSTTGETKELYKGGSRLGTHDCLWWLWSIGSPGDKLTFYSSGYDWTMILIDLPENVKDQVFGGGSDPFTPVWWEGWGICYLKGAVTIMRRYNGRVYRRFFADMWRCLGLGKFVNALEPWQVATKDEVEEIERMKDLRSGFDEITDEVAGYCRDECRMLCRIALRASVAASEVGIRPTQWYSAGSLSKALLRKHGVQRHRGPDRYAGAPDHLRTPIMSAYFGGRFENVVSGIIPEAYEYDLASAYPAMMTHLPCLEHGHWEVGRHGPWVIEHISWTPTNEEVPWGPLPFRTDKGSILWPFNGRGWYWSIEVDAAKRLKGYRLRRTKPWSWVQECDCEPFSWIPETYLQRLEMGKDGKGMMLKVAMNGGYGTTADTVSEDSKYASTVWAGLITAGTRARLMEVIAAHPFEVVMVATDGILTTAPLFGDVVTKNLGAWDFKQSHHDVFVVQPGLYWSDDLDKKRTRGHSAKDIQRLAEDLKVEWKLHGFQGTLSYQRTRFIPARLALRRKDKGQYGQWIPADVTIKFKPAARLPSGERIGEHCVRSWPTGEFSRADSAPYDKLVALETNRTALDEQILDEDQP